MSATNPETEPGGPLQSVVRARRMSYVRAVTEELKCWRMNDECHALVLAFCACVGERMQGRDMRDVLKPPNNEQ